MPLDAKTLRKIGRRIREARKDKERSQEQLAEASGLSGTYIGRLERGEKKPSLDTLVLIADSLEVSVVDLLLDLEVKADKSKIRQRIKKLVDLL